MKPYKKLWWPRFRPFFWVVDELKPTKRGPRGASNYGLFIIVRKTSPEWQIQQEIYESRYWLRHPWRLMHWIWFAQGIRSLKWREENPNAYKRAAAHLSHVEAASRAQEIRAKLNYLYDMDKSWKANVRTAAKEEARDYARSIHGASNYPFFAAAGWTEDDCYNEITKHL